jgi:NTP pyrophosphatase (non-canonical NTP hydrolase)
MIEFKNMCLYAMARDLWGITAQVRMFAEECLEAAMAVTKVLDRDRSVRDLAEEIADVEIMVEQMRMFYNHDGLIDRYKKEKLERLASRVAHAAGKKDLFDVMQAMTPEQIKAFELRSKPFTPDFDVKAILDGLRKKNAAQLKGD